MLKQPHTAECTALLHLAYWAETESYVQHCPSCQVNKGSNQKPYGLMQPNEVPPYPWHTVATDYATGFPMAADNHNAIAVFVDALTTYTVIVPCTKESSGADWAHIMACLRTIRCPDRSRHRPDRNFTCFGQSYRLITCARTLRS